MLFPKTLLLPPTYAHSIFHISFSDLLTMGSRKHYPHRLWQIQPEDLLVIWEMQHQIHQQHPIIHRIWGVLGYLVVKCILLYLVLLLEETAVLVEAVEQITLHLLTPMLLPQLRPLPLPVLTSMNEVFSSINSSKHNII